MKATVVIPAYNAARTIELVLRALQKQRFSDFSVVLVDDASNDGTSEIAGECDSALDLHIIRSDQNLGRAQARNLGIAKSKGEIILLLDSDIEASPDYIEEHIKLHDRIPRAVAVGSLRYPPELARKALARYYGSRGGARLKPGDALPGKYFISCLASFPRRIYEEVGGFDAGFRFYGGEDLELGLRFQKAGAQMRYLSSAVGYHHHLRLLSEVMKTMEKYGESGIPLVLARHPEFSRELRFEDLTSGSPSVWRGTWASDLLFEPLKFLADRLQNGYLPSALLTYLHYCAYRRGFRRYLASRQPAA